MNFLVKKSSGEFFLQYLMVGGIWQSSMSSMSSSRSNLNILCTHLILIQGIDGSARKPALLQISGYMVEKTYHIAPYLGAFKAYLILQ